MTKEMTTRESILELLKKQKQLSVSGLKKHLDITEMAVRKHLVKLEGEQLISSKTVRQPMGRPVIFYSLTSAGENLFPTKYDTITMEFLNDIEETMGPEAIDNLFLKREKRMYKKYARRIFAEDELSEKVKALVQVQEESGYMSEFQEENEEELSFSQYNCPIVAIANKYDKPCECELNLFKNVLGTDEVERVECLAKGGNACKYVVKKAANVTTTNI
ncbi:helix-turn-helix transcriptional regulator [Saliterribacillus persicus]|uniref:Putative ArsR family transcriptional regulator n=1 Tax=Saliterribacillus persicus TaxID=930114 RepID=A0A368X4D0_9BACI|nr:metalloregulator ArsR/SmtB family transcription factor [Saliterribacillus persicus]RCW62850.1 putative ArsR family transcriptional regulator [Saliterribacillus persicus]